MHNKNNIIIISHRRSGTHLTIDSILNNFSIFKETPEISEVTLRSDINEDKSLKIKKFINNSPVVLKSHSHGHIKDYYKSSSKAFEIITEIFNRSKIIYVYRDIRDVLVSQYYYQRQFDKNIKELDINSYVMMKNNFDNDSYTGKMNRIEYWKYHVNSWIKKNSILTISFEELLGEYEKVIKKIGIYIDEDLPKNIIDVRRSKNLKTDSLKKQLIRKHSSISFRKGEVGDWKNHLSKDVQDYISNNVGELLNELKFEENKYYEEKI